MQRELVVNNFEAVAREWFGKNTHVWTKKHATTVIRRLELNVFPIIGNRPIKLVTAPELLEVLRKIESRGAIETAHRVWYTSHKAPISSPHDKFFKEMPLRQESAENILAPISG